MANLKELLVNGVSRFIGKVYINDSHITTINGVAVTEDPKFTDTTALDSMTGTLGVDHGGTGQTTAGNAINSLMGGLPAWSATPTDTTNFIRQDTGGSATYGKAPFSTLWTYIKGKIDTDGSYANKNVFGKVKVGSTTIEADTTQDTLEIVGSTNVTITPDATNDKITISATDTTYTFDGTYDASTNKAATVSTVTNAINALDGGTIGTPSASKTLTALSQSNGNISATFGDISITKSQVSDFPTSMTPSSHTHGNIQNGGTLQTNDITVASGDKLVVTDSSDSNKVARTSIAFDGSTATKALTQKGTWENFTNNAGTVTSVQVQATSPVQSSTNTASSTTLNTTISLADGYGDTKNPYASKTKNYVLAAPTSANGTPSFRALDASDIPSLTKSKISDFPTTWALSNITGADDLKAIEALSGTSGILKKTASNTWALDTSSYITGITSSDVTTALGYTPYNSTNPDGYTTNTGTVTSVTLKAGGGVSLDTDNTAITTSGTRTISHADTSSQASITASDRTYVKSVTLDTYGHVTGLTTGTETVTDTKNTAGSTDSSSKLFLIGATSQAANPQTYSQDTAYVGTDGHLYSNSKQVVNLSDSQALTNKTYNGYTLAAASAKGVDTSLSSGTTSVNLPTSKAVVEYISTAIAASDAMIFKGTLGTGGTVTALPTTYKTGWTYRVITAGTYAGNVCEIGDLIIALVDRNGSGNVNADWTVAQTNVDGALTTAGGTVNGALDVQNELSANSASIGNMVVTGNAVFANGLTGNVTGNVSGSAGSVAWGNVSGKPSATNNGTTGISIAAHGTGTVIGVQSSTTSVTGVQSSTTTASKVTLGTAISVPNVTGATDVTVPVAASSATTVPIKNATATSIPNVTSAGSASNWVFEDVTVPIKATSATTVPIAASSATAVPIKDASATSIPNVTAVGSGSASLSFAMDATDTKKLIVSFSHTHTPPTIGTPISITGVQSTTTSVTGVSGSTSVTGVQSTTTTGSHVKSGGNGSAPTLGTAISIYGVQSTTTSVTGVSGSTTASKVTLGTAISVPNVTGATDVTVPIKDTSATTVPIKNASASTFVTGTTHTITDNGHTHSIT